MEGWRALPFYASSYYSRVAARHVLYSGSSARMSMYIWARSRGKRVPLLHVYKGKGCEQELSAVCACTLCAPEAWDV